MSDRRIYSSKTNAEKKISLADYSAKKSTAQVKSFDPPDSGINFTATQLKTISPSNRIVIQRKLSDAQALTLRTHITRLLPTLPESFIQKLIAESSSVPAALKAAKTQAEIIEGDLLKRDPHTSSVHHASRSLAAELFNSYSPKTHHYILLGNSPAVLQSALMEARSHFSHFPLGGLTDAEAQKITFGKALHPDETRSAYTTVYDKSKNLKVYLFSFLETIRMPNLVIIDYTHSGLSAIIAADLLTKASKEMEQPKTVKLFTFSGELPDEESMLMRQNEYDLVSEAPLGVHERTFTTLTDTKAYKDPDRLNLSANRSLKLHELEGMEDPRFHTVSEALSNTQGKENLKSV